MTTLSLSIDPGDESSITKAINVLQRLLGNASPAPAALRTMTATAMGLVPAVAPVEVKKADAPAAGQPAVAPAASSNKPALSPAEAFKEVQKPFLDLSLLKDGRDRCLRVLAAHGIAKLGEAKPEQYESIKAAIKKEAGV